MGAVTVWAAAILVTPVWASVTPAGNPSRLTAAVVRHAGSLICHQRPERSFAYAGTAMPVCARCAGLYVGGAVGAMAWLLIGGVGRALHARARRFANVTVARRALIIAAVPTLASVALAWSGVWDAPNWLRAALAAPLGAVVAAIVSAVAAKDLR